MPITNRVIFQNSNGNVGIGNNAPTHTLRVEGSLSATGNANVGNIGATRGLFTNIVGTLETAAQTNITSLGTLTSLAVTGNITSGNVSGTRGAFTNVAGTLETAAQTNITSVGTLSALTVSGNLTVDTNTLFVDSANNRVGIGTTSPGYPLDVNGAIAIRGNENADQARLYFQASDNSNRYTIESDLDGNNNLDLLGFRSSSTDNILVLKGDGNVGIGNAAPAHKLRVEGTFSASGNANVGNLGTAGLISATGNISGGNLTTAGVLSVTGNANVGNIGATRGTFTNVAGTLETAAQTNITSIGTLTSLAVSGNAIFNTNTLFVDSVNNEVGIGTTSPLAILNTNAGTITGPAVTPGLMLTSLYSGVTAVNSIDWNYSGQTTSPVRLGATFNSGGAGMEMVFYTSTSYTTTGSERMRINMDGNVGVGTVSPGYRLHVVNNSDTSIAYYAISKNDGGSSDGFQIVDDRGFAGVNSGKTFRVLTRNDGTNDTGAIASFETVGGSSSTRMRINIDGNVGIGNSAPAHTLRVEGTFSATGNANVGNLGTTGSIIASGNVTGNYILGNGSLLSGIITSVANINLGTSNVTVVSSGGNITVGVGGTNNVAVFATTGEYITGVLSVTGNANVGNIGATRGVFTNIVGTLETAAQTNITSLGTLTSLSVTGNANVGNIGATNGVFTNVSGSGSAMTSLPAGNLTGTIPSGVLGNSSHFIGTTSIALNRASANQSLTGITSLVMPGSTSGNVTLQPAATAGTTTITLPATTGTVVTTGDSGTVTSTMIADGTIVNGDINASAAIAVSKLAASTISGVTLGNNLNTLTLNTSGTGLSGSTTYNGSGAATFTVTSNATSANTVSAIVARDASGNFSAGTITATLSGTASSATLALSIPQSAKSADYTLAIGDRGYHISISAGNITVPASVFSAGDAITIYNNAATNRTIIQGASTTLRLAGTANTGNRTLAQYGVATVLCVASNTFVISGNGLT